MPPRDMTIAETVLQIIRERGPKRLDALVPEIVAAGRTRAKDPRRAVSTALEYDPRFIRSWGGSWCSLFDQLDGAVFTTPLTALERADEIVIMRDHLALVQRVALRSRPVAKGGEVHLDFFGDFFELPWPDDRLAGGDMREILGPELADELLGLVGELGLPLGADEEETLRDIVWEMRSTSILHGSHGWLPPLRSRQLLGIGIRSGAVETVALDRRDVVGPHVGVVAAQVERLAALVLGPDPSWFGPPVMPLEELLELVATESPELLRRPLPPFPEVVARGGLEVRDGYVGRPGTDWEAAGLLIPVPSTEAWGFEPSRAIH